MAAGGKESGTTGTIYIPVISRVFQHQFWQAVKLGAENAGKDNKVVRHLRRPREPRRWWTSSWTCCRPTSPRNPSAIVFAALDSKAAIPLLQKAKDRKIPIIAFDSGVDSDIPLTTCATDNIAAAALAADKMAAFIGGSGKVGVIVQRPDQPHRHRQARRIRQSDEGEVPQHPNHRAAVRRGRPAQSPRTSPRR